MHGTLRPPMRPVVKPVRRVEVLDTLVRRLNGGPVGTEDDRMHVDLGAICPPHRHPSGRPVDHHFETGTCEQGECLVRLDDGDVEIGVRPGLASSEGIDAPAAADPRLDAACPQQVEHLEHRVHRRHTGGAVPSLVVSSRMGSA